MEYAVGIDVIEIVRVKKVLARHPERFLRRVFTAEEVAFCRGRVPELAARFAAKEAIGKALGTPGNLAWTDAEVIVGEHGRPHLEIRGTVADRAAELGVTSWHLSLSHDGGMAAAVVLAEGAEPA